MPLTDALRICKLIRFHPFLRQDRDNWANAIGPIRRELNFASGSGKLAARFSAYQIGLYSPIEYASTLCIRRYLCRY